MFKIKINWLLYKTVNNSVMLYATRFFLFFEKPGGFELGWEPSKEG